MQGARNIGGKIMRGWIHGVWLMLLPFCVPLATAEQAAGGVAAVSGVPATTPAEDFAAADKADKDDDMITAGRLYRRAADGGHAEAQVRFGHILYRGSANERALEYYRKSAAQGNADGQYSVGFMYEGGEGGVAQDMAEARKWYALAAQQGHALSIQTLANACTGPSDSVLSKIYNKAKRDKMILDAAALCGPDPLLWIKRAVDIDYVPAVTALANAYRSGLYGLTADQKQADELDAKANKLLGIVVKKKKKTRQ